MAKETKINIFHQIKSFYSIVFNGDFDLKPTHISLYMFLLNQNNRNNWVEWFKCPFDLAMQGASIGSKNTYYKCLSELQSFGFINYEKGINNYKAPKIKIINLFTISKNDTLTEPLCEPLTIPLSEQVLVPLSDNIIRLITNNYKTLNNKEKEFSEFLENINKLDILIDEIETFSIQLFNDDQWNEDICRMNKINSDVLLKYLNKFDLKLKSELETKINKKEYASHFSRWLKIELEKNTNKNQKQKLTGAQAFIQQFENL